MGILISCDNTTAADAANRTIRMRKLQTTAMRHHWIQDRVHSGQFVVKWSKGSDNKADFFHQNPSCPRVQNYTTSLYLRSTCLTSQSTASQFTITTTSQKFYIQEDLISISNHRFKTYRPTKHQHRPKTCYFIIYLSFERTNFI